MAKKKTTKPTSKSASKKAKEKVSSPEFIAKAPIRRLMRNHGADLVAENAVLGLINYLEEWGAKVTKNAMDIVKKEKRKRISAADIKAGASM
ncbi:hypothetical protein GF325_17055 [Candidatus Bathyarchaeota archaeon]|nr:hypothetical protein [Candidatus Bathyarchaeota archaeon]